MKAVPGICLLALTLASCQLLPASCQPEPEVEPRPVSKSELNREKVRQRSKKPAKQQFKKGMDKRIEDAKVGGKEFKK